MGIGLLDEVLRRKKEERELKRKKMLKKIEEVLNEVGPCFKEAYIFGGVTKPYRWNENSDVDIGFLGLGNEEWFLVFRTLSEKLGRDVDILHLENHRLRDKIIREGIKIEVGKSASKLGG